MDAVTIVNRTRGSTLGRRVEVADGWWERLRGYLARPRPEPGEGMLLVPCTGVHMYGVRFPLDLLFVGPEGRVLDLVSRARPWSRTRRVREATAVLEVPAGTIVESGTERGDVLEWTLADGFRASAGAEGTVSRRDAPRRSE